MWYSSHISWPTASHTLLVWASDMGAREGGVRGGECGGNGCQLFLASAPHKHHHSTRMPTAATRKRKKKKNQNSTHRAHVCISKKKKKGTKAFVYFCFHMPSILCGPATWLVLVLGSCMQGHARCSQAQRVRERASRDHIAAKRGETRSVQVARRSVAVLVVVASPHDARRARHGGISRADWENRGEHACASSARNARRN